MPVTDIAERFPISRPAISQHLRVLKDAGLVTDTAVATRRAGTQINPDAFVLRGLLRRFLDGGVGRDSKNARKNAARHDGDAYDSQCRPPCQFARTLVHASPEDAFDASRKTWIPGGRGSHHIGKVPMQRVIIEPKASGRCYTVQVDGTECD